MKTENQKKEEKNPDHYNTIVTIISIWSKGGPLGPNAVEYDVNVPEVAGDELATLENAFALTNMDNRPLRRGVCSTTAGDIMGIGGHWFLVQGSGFKRITGREALWIKNNCDSRDTSFGYDWLAKHNLLPPERKS